jgi:hypothetical protein
MPGRGGGRALVASALAALGIVMFEARGPAAPGPLFREVAAEVGLDFTHDTGATGEYYMPEVMGAGAALFDYDNDGDLDVFFVQSGPIGSAHSAGAKPKTNHRLFRNDLSGGTLRFTDVTLRSGIALKGYGMGAATGDYDGDGDLDLLITSFGPETLYRNNGDGTFTDVTAEANVSDDVWSTSAAFVDYDRDGHLDLFVANYVDFTLPGNKPCADPIGARDYCSPRVYHPVPDRLYRNNGNGTFANVSESAGIVKADGAGLGVSSGDYNRDGWLDLYVANDATPNQLWINRRNGTFVDEGMISGSAVNAAGNPEGSMGIASGDFDQDGDEDLFITNIIGETFVLYQNDGQGNFEDVRTRVGLGRPTAASTGFGTDWIDLDNDGWLDLFVANGAVNIVETQRGQPTPFRMKNQLFRNRGDGGFEEVTTPAGPAFARAEIGRGVAFGDIDNDGDIDCVVSNNGGAARLFINQASANNKSLQVRLQQPGANRFAVGAWVGVERSARKPLWRRVKTDGSYLSANDLRLHFGLGDATKVDAVIVEWPDGERERFTDIKIPGVITLERRAGSKAVR